MVLTWGSVVPKILPKIGTSEPHGGAISGNGSEPHGGLITSQPLGGPKGRGQRGDKAWQRNAKTPAERLDSNQPEKLAWSTPVLTEATDANEIAAIRAAVKASDAQA